MSAHQCPRCELKFSFRTEVEAHLATDHRPRNPEVVTHDPDSPAEPAVSAKPQSDAAPRARQSETAGCPR